MRPSVIVITKNEEDNLTECLQSIPDKWPCIIVDSGSTDKTLEIARELNATVISKQWEGFGLQKQFAVNAAKPGWILSLDADERLCKRLVLEIESTDGSETSRAYAIPRSSHFLGKPIRFCGWRPDYVIRLFHSSQCRFTEDIVHERVEGYESIAWLAGQIRHFPYRDEDSVKNKTLLYGELGKQKVIFEKRKTGLLIAFLKSFWAFIRTYILKLGFLDGLSGLAISWMNAQVTFIKYR